MATNPEDLNLISASQYDIYSKLLYLAGKYTDVQNEDFLRSGLFGYITESMAMILRDSSIHNTMLYNESFLNTAVIPKTIYNWAKMFNININCATPAYADIEITISESDFESYSRNGSGYGDKYGTLVSQTYKDEKLLIIDKSNNFLAGPYNFMLEHSIMIKRNSNAFYAQYLDDEVSRTTEFQTYSSPILNTKFISDQYGENYIIVSARVYQYKIMNIEKIIASSSFLDRKIHEFEFTDQFVGASCIYEKNGVETPVKLIFSNIDVDAKTSYYCFYNLLDENKLQLKFPDTLDAFKPSANSKLKVSIYTSLGDKGNISYTGDVVCRLNDELMRNLAISVKFANDKAVGGVNSPTLNEIKSKVINEISTRDVIVTETDLNNYFSVLKSMLQSINKGQVKFVKKKDDILRRVFTAYILLKDTPETTDYFSPDIQTNTVDVDTTLTSQDNFSSQFGSVIQYNKSTDTYTLVRSTTYPYTLVDISNSSINTDDTFICPFYIYISLSPVRRVKYIYNLANDSTSLSIKKGTSLILGNNDSVIIPSSVEVHRDFSWDTGIEKGYRFKFNFTTNFQFTGQPQGEMLLYFEKEGLNSSIANFSFNANDDNCIWDNGGEEADSNGFYYPSCEIFLKVDETEFLFPSSDVTDPDYGATISIKGERLTEDVIPCLRMNNIVMNSEVQSFSIDVKADSQVTLFKNLDDIMNSDLQVNYGSDGQTINSITIKSVPILSKNFSTSKEKVENFISQLFTYITMLKENLEKLETNTFFDLKFFNSFGTSRYYNTHRTDLKLELKVRLKQLLEPSMYYKDIRNYIRTVVDAANEEGSLKISHVIAHTVAKFYDVIESIDFEGLNNSFTQYIKPNTTIEATKKIQLAPEHFGIPDENLKYITVCDYNGKNGFGIDFSESE